MGAPAPPPGKTILLADDEESLRKVLGRRIASWGYTILTAPSGAEALRLAAAHRPDLILLDLMMPGLNGLEVCRQLKQSQQTQQIPVVLVTAKALQLIPEEVRAAGAVALLAKPYEPEDLLRLIRQVTEPPAAS